MMCTVSAVVLCRGLGEADARVGVGGQRGSWGMGVVGIGGGFVGAWWTLEGSEVCHRWSRPTASSLVVAVAAGIAGDQQDGLGLGLLGHKAGAEQEQGGQRGNHRRMFLVLGGGHM
jgi:hypothetical protein